MALGRLEGFAQRRRLLVFEFVAAAAQDFQVDDLPLDPPELSVARVVDGEERVLRMFVRLDERWQEVEPSLLREALEQAVGLSELPSAGEVRRLGEGAPGRWAARRRDP